jgi:periplasmic divalent cation tolerance protein
VGGNDVANRASIGFLVMMLMIAWTTVGTSDEAERIATDSTLLNETICIQIEGPIRSYYRWQGKPEQAEEYRLTLKCLPAHLDAVSHRVHALHPYSIPQWVVVATTSVSEKYLSWARTNVDVPPF